MLSLSAFISSALGLFQDFGSSAREPPANWVEGVAIIIAITIVVSSIVVFAVRFQVTRLSCPQVIVGSLSDWQVRRQFRALDERKEERSVKVIRDGAEEMIDIKVFLTFIQYYALNSVFS